MWYPSSNGCFIDQSVCFRDETSPFLVSWTYHQQIKNKGLTTVESKRSTQVPRKRRMYTAMTVDYYFETYNFKRAVNWAAYLPKKMHFIHLICCVESRR
ncbi:hypothetical protein EG68_12270 [Paragonimus skrjabini miyazakii]|uniref:Uncharacterized protein n=1 Tax=Paragonimus skrjabini miyazakii TaxID=59628 RepID=A0A8S9YD65_9TREM|nr:hypothetical protein EG68_12270 [Paragonimus skrjabini miyazakii]